METTPELRSMIASMMDAHSQWEQENKFDRGADNQFPWTTEHLSLLARAALMAIREPTRSALHAAATDDTPRTATNSVDRMYDHILGEPTPPSHT